MTPHLAETPVIETERLVLRAPTPADYPAWESFFLSDRARYVGGGPDFDEGRAWRAFASFFGHWAMRGCGIFAIEDRRTRANVGAIGPWYPAGTPEKEISWSIWDPAFEGSGRMAEAARAVLAHVFADLGWTTAVSYIDGKNTRSVALATRLGASVDASARGPHPDDIVYRHPRPEARA